MKNSKKIILFDFDGVLVDSFETNFKVTKKFASNSNFSENNYKKLFEGNIYKESFKNGMKRSDKFLLLNSYALEVLQLPAIEGICNMLKELSCKYKLIIISSGLSSYIKDWLLDRGLNNYFVEVLGADIHESKVEKIKMVFEKYGTNNNNCLFITDTLGDLREAEMAGIKSLAVTYGFHEEHTLLKGNPIGLINKPEDIEIEVKKFFNRDTQVLDI